MDDEATPPLAETEVARRVREAAGRARTEAEARRRAEPQTAHPKELQGRGGLDPARFGDWEVKGLASDF